MQPDLFDATEDIAIEPGARLLAGFARSAAADLLAAIPQIESAAAFRRWEMRGGRRLGVAMTNCGDAGWVSDPSGYRYDPVDPWSGRRWPGMPPSFRAVARAAAAAAGFPGFAPDVCLVNRYEPGTGMSLHRDRDERDLAAPIVSVSLGLPATFLWGGRRRADRPRRLRLHHGDVVVWGGPARLVYHGVAPLGAGEHPLTGARRYNLTFRKR